MIVPGPVPKPPSLADLRRLANSPAMTKLFESSPRQFVTQGLAEDKLWQLFVRSTPLGVCVAIAVEGGGAERCGVASKLNPQPVVAFRERSVHLIFGAVPRSAAKVRVAMESFAAVDATPIIVRRLPVAVFVVHVPPTSGNAVVEAFDRAGESIGRFGVPS